MFGKKKKTSGIDDTVAMRIVAGGKTRNVTYRELLLSTNMSLEALMSVLVKKGVISPDDLLGAIDEIRRLQIPSPSSTQEKPDQEPA